MESATRTRDRLLTGEPLEGYRKAAYRVITRTQDTPSTQVMGTALALAGMCRALNVDMRELIERVEAEYANVDGPFSTQLRALEAYTKSEIGRSPL